MKIKIIELIVIEIEGIRLKKLSKPIIYKVNYSREDAQNLDDKIRKNGNIKGEEQKYLIDYPTVYVIASEKSKRYTVYVGETNNIKRRTLEHIDVDSEVREDWQKLKEFQDAEMYIVGHEHFNKSLTLDIENRLMQYMSSVESVEKINNRRENSQNKYYTSDEMKKIFDKIWKQLHRENPRLFPAKKLIEDSALFKASPFNKLTKNQLYAKDEILSSIDKALSKEKSNQLIKVIGNAGAGKTVLMSNIFYELAKKSNIKTVLMVNHLQQEKIYRQIAKKLDLTDNAEVLKVTTFLNQTDVDFPVDVAFVDEAHLLLTQRSQAYYGHGTNELIDIIKRAKVTLAVYDEKQILQTTQIIEDDDRLELEKFDTEYIFLNDQMRIKASKETVEWIRKFIDDGEINPVPNDESYDLRLFDTPQEMQEAIFEKNTKDRENGLSRMVATFDWDYSSTKKERGYWEVSEGEWHMPWNLQLKPSKSQKNASSINYGELSWPEQPHTIDEIGSHYTVQGMDLNYVGVEIGPSVKYRDGRVVFDPTASSNKKAINNRTMHSGEKKKFGKKLLRNELNVLLTRGVHGLYIHAVDDELQQALKRAFKKGE